MTAIRKAVRGDLERITEIYNQAVIRTTATFDTMPKTIEEREGWFRRHDERHPILVAEEEGGVEPSDGRRALRAGSPRPRGCVCGWASLSSYSDRAAYDRTVEISIYVSEERRGKGIGKSLMQRIVGEARDLGHHVILARIAEGNPASVRLHESAGFFMVGTMKEVGAKFGRLLDVHLMEKILAET